MNFINALVVLGIAILALALPAGWITNIIWTFHQSTLIDVLLGVVGIIVAPIGAVHGIYTWF